MVKINAPFDSDQYPKAILLQSEDDIAVSYCGQCHHPAEDWPRQVARHPRSRPGVMFQAELFCSACKTWAWDEHTGERVNSYTGEPDPWPSEEQHANIHRVMQDRANEQGSQTDNCMGCGQRFQPEDFRVGGEGPMTSLFKVVPLTDEARAWVDDNVSEEGFQPDWPVLYVEHRYLDDLIEGIEGAGLTVGRRVLAGAGAC